MNTKTNPVDVSNSVTRYVLDNRFIRIINEKAKETIYHIKNNNIYIPDCTEENTVEIIENIPRF